MVLDQSKFCTKCYKMLYMIFQLLKYHEIKIFKFYYVIGIITCTNSNRNFLKFIISHFYIASTVICFLDLSYVLHNDSK